ncbi:nucleotide-binding protein [Paenibacillus phoenicis]|uniref:Nucleotide-binding protein n=1 Tax=Paenibacillus phoenicis TaxID=554117 RepID=A0ABU5PHQ5_9BACL|nr:TIR domain-containing protein [Paenibacillus phoenicis]MEA3569423.1 nucleotide-binding protein [Paenibacillus phoenicis]
MDVTKPNVFIGSSREAMDIANGIHAQINRYAQVTPWYAGAFEGNDYTMESLEKQLHKNDFGVFIFAPDDIALYRGKFVFITRDNTLFEMGLFWGRLGRRRVFAIIPQEIRERDDLIQGENVSEYHLLSDLQGLTLLRYEVRTDGNEEAAVAVACRSLIKAILAEGVYRDPHVEIARMEMELERKRRILHLFWTYNKNITVPDEQDRYNGLSEAIRTSIIPPPGYLVTGAALWKVQGDEGIGQVGGNVGKGRFFTFQENQERVESGQQPIYVLDAYLTAKWAFFNRLEVEQVYILCYPLGREHVLSVHFSGRHHLTDEQLGIIVSDNNELLRTIDYILGGDSI